MVVCCFNVYIIHNVNIYKILRPLINRDLDSEKWEYPAKSIEITLNHIVVG